MLKLPRLLRKHIADATSVSNFVAVTFDPYGARLVLFKVPDFVDDSVDVRDVTPEALYSAQVFYSDDTPFPDESASLDSLISRGLNLLKSQGSEVPEALLFGISARQCVDIMSIVRYSQLNSARVTEDHVTSLYSQVHSHALLRAQDIIADRTGDMDASLEPITSKEVALLLDGTSVADPLGLIGNELELRWFSSFAPATLLARLQHIASIVDLPLLGVSSQAYAFHSSLLGTPEFSNSVIIDFGLDATTVYVVFGGSIVDSRYLSIGVAGLLAEISDVLDVHWDVALEVLFKFTRNTLDASIASKVSPVVSAFSRVWLDGLRSLFLSFTSVRTFSPRIVLVGYGFEVPQLLSVIRTSAWYKEVSFKTTPSFSVASSTANLPARMDFGLGWAPTLSLGYIFKEMRHD